MLSTIYSTIKNAKQGGNKGKTSDKTVIKVSANYMEVLIGGSYTGHPYGHAALRVVTLNKDYTYDFGRYGKTWGLLNSEGEGVLRFWQNFNNYIKGEKLTGRETIGYVYYLTKDEAESIITYFDSIMSSSKKAPDNGYTRCILQTDYHAITNNCTTITIDGAQASGKKIVKNPLLYAKGRGLNTLEKNAAFAIDSSEHKIFMPADLQAMLEGNTTLRYDKKIHINIGLILLILVILVYFSAKEQKMKMYEIQEPLRISSYEQPEEKKAPFYILPAGSVLYHTKAMPEGFDTYIIYANFKGKLNAKEIPMQPKWQGNFIAPIWLEQITKDDLKKMVQQFPLTKNDVTEIIKSNGLTRDDLADIIRELPENK